MVTLLLTVSALYIVIFANVPLVGYSTFLDNFVFGMFVIQIVSSLLHVFYYGLTAKYHGYNSDQVARYLRNLIAFFLQLIGRTCVIPVAIAVFYACFLVDDGETDLTSSDKASHSLGVTAIVIAVIVSVGLIMFQMDELKHHCKK